MRTVIKHGAIMLGVALVAITTVILFAQQVGIGIFALALLAFILFLGL